MSASNQAFIILGGTIVAFIIGQYAGRALKMKDHGWKIGIVLGSVVLASTLCWLRSPKLGIDLRGGVILIYEVNEEKTLNNASDQAGEELDDERVDMAALIEALQRRVNPSGLKEVVIRPYGERQVEIIVPEVASAEIQQIKDDIVTSGFLKFRIVADRTRNPSEWEAGERVLAATDPRERAANGIRAGGKVVAEWVRLAKEKTVEGEPQQYKMPPSPDMLIRELEEGDKEVLMVLDPFSVEGRHLRGVSGSFDQNARPCVTFRMTNEGSRLFEGLTSDNLPDKQTGSYAKLGIVMDQELLTAPRIMSTISSNGEITGNFTAEEVDGIVRVLRAGRLPAVLHENPISENNISPLLGEDTIRKGRSAIAASLIAILAFMLLYYRFAGFVSCLALVVNLAAIVGIMILIKAAFTLPGLAGLVLTVGMSVDANVLVFERIREELLRGATLRMAIRNGFGRATTTIVDAQLTTLITALVLYGIGTDQIRGFATTLILGILMSMFTAIFCSRVIFDIAEKKKWLTKLRMMQLVTKTNINFVGMRKMAAGLSMVAILVGVGAVAARGTNIFDIDFLGGTSVQAMLTSPMPIEEVRTTVADVADDVSVTQVNPENQAKNTVYKIDTSITDENELQRRIQAAFIGEDGRSLLVSHSMSFSSPVSFSAEETSDAEADTGATDEVSGRTRDADRSASAQLSGLESTSDEVRAASGGDQLRLAQVGDDAAEGDGDDTPVGDSAVEEGDVEEGDLEEGDVEEGDLEEGDLEEGDLEPLSDEGGEVVSDEPVGDDTAGDELAGDELAGDEPAGDTGANADTAEAATAEVENDSAVEQAGAPVGVDGDTAADADGDTPSNVVNFSYFSQSELEFDEKISQKTLGQMIASAAESIGVDPPRVELHNPDRETGSEAGFAKWTVKFSTTPTATTEVLEQLENDLSHTPAWLSSNKIGSKVARNMQTTAVAAIIVALLGIVAYIWIRFQRVVFGLAAVLALVHDVAITLGAIAISMWLAEPLGFLLIDQFKISLPIVAAFLTIIGYSLNDTIVVFDRIREVKGKSPELTPEMINTSINQTLSRTLLTSTTTLLVVSILYIFGGQGIHGFAFALLIGVLVGTYSSIFVASPALLWMSGSSARKRSQKRPTKAVSAAT